MDGDLERLPRKTRAKQPQMTIADSGAPGISLFGLAIFRRHVHVAVEEGPGCEKTNPQTSTENDLKCNRMRRMKRIPNAE